MTLYLALQDSKFDIAQVVDYFWHKPDGDLAIYYEMEENESTFSRGVVEVCPESNRWVFLPGPSEVSPYKDIVILLHSKYRKQLS